MQAFLEDRVAQFRDETGLTGVAVAVMIDGQSAGAAASGERRRGSGIPVTVDDCWHIGSITKSMTATLLAVLEDDGQLSLNDTLPALLPDVEMAAIAHPNPRQLRVWVGSLRAQLRRRPRDLAQRQQHPVVRAVNAPARQ